ncbi:uncharacterized protein LOC132255876 [Phlebotomus argentipes]|uniref:uncharacterized protein LOC132255876 n=1 Tax=Phlebotomus argentipes TaxID=94469 RepID=UPI0028933BC6|nr:uncharacterized protein LOC132255876 [Phlebotomus argentipes]
MEIGVKQEENLLKFVPVKDEFSVKKEEVFLGKNAEVESETVEFVIQKVREQKHKCHFCGKSCKSVYNLKDHMVTHSKEKNFQCSECLKCFGNQRRLDNHMKTHSDESLPCNLCAKTFKSATHLKFHMQRHSGGKKHECEMCGKRFSDSSHKRRHIRQIHEGKKPEKGLKSRMPCSQCGKILWNKASYERHQLVKHSSSRNLKCPLCPKAFKLKYNLTEHMLVHSKEKPFACDVCQKGFKRKSNLMSHSASHESQPTICQYCSKTYSNRENLKAHIRSRHRGLPPDIRATDEVVFCTVCTKDFQNLAALKNHVEIHVRDKKRKLCVCPYCGKTLLDWHNYQRHLVIHIDVSPFKCATCAKTFKRKDAIVKHVRIHIKNRPRFTCKVCGAKLIHKKTLRQHDRKHALQMDTTRIKIETDDNYLQTEIEISGTMITKADTLVVFKREEELQIPFLTVLDHVFANADLRCELPGAKGALQSFSLEMNSGKMNCQFTSSTTSFSTLGALQQIHLFLPMVTLLHMHQHNAPLLKSLPTHRAFVWPFIGVHANVCHQDFEICKLHFARLSSVSDFPAAHGTSVYPRTVHSHVLPHILSALERLVASRARELPLVAVTPLNVLPEVQLVAERIATLITGDLLRPRHTHSLVLSHHVMLPRARGDELLVALLTRELLHAHLHATRLARICLPLLAVPHHVLLHVRLEFERLGAESAFEGRVDGVSGKMKVQICLSAASFATLRTLEDPRGLVSAPMKTNDVSFKDTSLLKTLPTFRTLKRSLVSVNANVFLERLDGVKDFLARCASHGTTINDLHGKASVLSIEVILEHMLALVHFAAHHAEVELHLIMHNLLVHLHVLHRLEHLRAFGALHGLLVRVTEHVTIEGLLVVAILPTNVTGELIAWKARVCLFMKTLQMIPQIPQTRQSQAAYLTIHTILATHPLDATNLATVDFPFLAVRHHMSGNLRLPLESLRANGTLKWQLIRVKSLMKSQMRPSATSFAAHTALQHLIQRLRTLVLKSHVCAQLSFVNEVLLANGTLEGFLTRVHANVNHQLIQTVVHLMAGSLRAVRTVEEQHLVSLHMHAQLLGSLKGLAADATAEGLVSPVSLQMHSQMHPMLEHLRTARTLNRALIRVLMTRESVIGQLRRGRVLVEAHNVELQAARLEERLATVATLVTPDAEVSLQVNPQVLHIGEGLAAQLTLVQLPIGMDLQVCQQPTLICESLPALPALVLALLGVNCDVIPNIPAMTERLATNGTNVLLLHLILDLVTPILLPINRNLAAKDAHLMILFFYSWKNIRITLRTLRFSDCPCYPQKMENDEDVKEVKVKCENVENEQEFDKIVKDEEKISRKPRKPRKQEFGKLGNVKENKFKCTECDKSFACLSKIKTHMSVHVTEKSFFCTQCPKAFADQSRLKTHMKTHVEGRKTYPCHLCEKTLTTPESQKRHIETHSKSTEHRCVSCDKVFSRACDLNSHSVIHSTERLFKCLICEKAFPTARLLKNHGTLANHHTSDKKTVSCPQCQKTFGSNTHLATHMQKHSKDWHFPCPLCGKRFRKPTYLRIHLKRHSSDRHMFECEKCDKKYTTNARLIDHVQRKHLGMKTPEIAKKSYTCEICGKVSYTGFVHRQHVTSHSGIREFQCPICARMLRTKANLKGHLKTHNKPQKIIECGICKKTFKRQTNMDYHMKKHFQPTICCIHCGLERKTECDLKKHTELFHRGLPMSPNSTVCTICHEVFENLETLKEHVKIHPVELRFECGHCGKKFLDKQRIRQHIRIMHDKTYTKVKRPCKEFTCLQCGKILQGKRGFMAHRASHSDERPFECSICNKKFKVESFLQKHKKTIHNANRPNFPCRICGVGIKHKINMKRHLRITHNITEENTNIGEADEKKFPINPSDIKIEKTETDYPEFHSEMEIAETVKTEFVDEYVITFEQD